MLSFFTGKSQPVQSSFVPPTGQSPDEDNLQSSILTNIGTIMGKA